VIDCDSNDVGKLIDVLSKRRADVMEMKEGNEKTKYCLLIVVVVVVVVDVCYYHIVLLFSKHLLSSNVV
jgi:hypothetical protein